MKLYYQLFVFTTLFLLWNSPPLGEGPGVRENTAEFMLQYLSSIFQWKILNY